MIVLPGERIKEITAEGLTYLGENGAEAFIDFAVCRENFMDERSIRPEVLIGLKAELDMTDEQVKEYISRKVKYVGITGTPNSDRLYIEIWTTPHIKFEFPTEETLIEVQKVIRNAGWRTYDSA